MFLVDGKKQAESMSHEKQDTNDKLCFSVASGLVPTLMGASTIFGLPIGFHAAIQGSWQAVVLQIVVMVILGLVWYPFFRKADNDAYKLEQEAAK